MRFNRNIDTGLLVAGDFLEMFDIYWEDQDGARKEWQQTLIGDNKSNTVDFSVGLAQGGTIRGVLVASVRASYDYTKVFLSDP